MKRNPASFIYLLSATCYLLVGCSLLPLPHPKHPTLHKQDLVILDDGYQDFTGVIHIHTKYSDGSGTFEELARIANAQGLDFLIVTDHNTLQPLREGKQGWHGATLILAGCEISTRGGHYVALNLSQEIDRTNLTTQQIIDEVNRQGGFGFIAHPYGRRRWDDWTVRGFTGIEAYNASHDTLDENIARVILWTIMVPPEPFYFSILDRSDEPLAQWDRLLLTYGPVVGIGSADAHEYRALGLKFAPYEIMFRFVRTHLLIPDSRLTEFSVYEALRKGHAYFSFELNVEARGFSFFVQDEAAVLGVMGDTVPFQPGLLLTASLPAPASLTLIKDGRPIKTTTGTSWQVPVDEPGIYRIEATRHDKPWLFSNPIHIHPSEETAQKSPHMTDSATKTDESTQQTEPITPSPTPTSKDISKTPPTDAPQETDSRSRTDAVAQPSTEVSGPSPASTEASSTDTGNP